MKNTRKLKIYSKCRQRTIGYISIPVIRLEGIWLKELGFNEGQEINIRQYRKKIIITLYEEKLV